MSHQLLHLSHTDIRYDSRILKELLAINRIKKTKIHAIGVDLNEGAIAPDLKHLQGSITTLKLASRFVKNTPRAVRYTLNMLELTIACLIRGVAMKPAIVHCHDTLVLPAGVLLKIATGCKLVYDAHELESNKNGQSRLLSIGTLIIEKVSWNWIDLLISVSDSILNWYNQNLGELPKILILNAPEQNTSNHNTLVSHSRQSLGYFHKKYNIRESSLIFVYLGILGPGRGIEIILEAFAQGTQKAHVVFVGYGEHADLIDTYSKIHQNIHIHNPVPHNEVVNLVTSADVGLCLIENVSLSDFYSLPNKLFEYGFAGLHILGSAFPEISGTIERHSLGTTCKLTCSAIQNAVNQLCSNPPKKEKKDLTLLTWDTQAQRLIHSYINLLGISRKSENATI